LLLHLNSITFIS